MKRVILSFSLVLMSSVAFGAQSIQLAAGSSVRLQAGQDTVVSCDGGATQTGRNCTLKKNHYGHYDVQSANTHFGTFQNLDAAIEVLEKVKKAEICY